MRLLGLAQPGYTTLMRCTIGNGNIGVGRSLSRDFHDILHRILAIPHGDISQVHQLIVCLPVWRGCKSSRRVEVNILVKKINGRTEKFRVRPRGSPKALGAANGKAGNKKEAQAEESSASLAGEHDKENVNGGYVEEGKYGAW
jgi:hypothetical protein